MARENPSVPPGDHRRPPGSGPLTGALMATLLVLPVLSVLSVPLYARVTPRLAGVPFFYWYQFACLLLALVCLAAAVPIARWHEQQRPRRKETRW